MNLSSGEREPHGEELSELDIEQARFECVAGFNHLFQEAGYEHQEAEPLVPANDPTILFTNSAVGAMKRYMTGDVPVPETGIYLDQPCIRTQTLLETAGDSYFTTEFMLYFHMLGAYVGPDEYPELCRLTTSLLTDVYHVSPDKVSVLFDQAHDTLMEPWSDSIEKTGFNSQPNTFGEDFYNWQFGIPGVSGKGITLTVERDNNFGPAYVGNVIEMYRDGEVVGYGLGIGLETLLSSLHNLKKPIQSSGISSIVPFDDGPKTAFADLLQLTTAVYHNDIRPGRNGRNHIAKTALIKLSRAVDTTYTSMHECKQLIDQFETLEFGSTTGISDQIVLDLKTIPYK